MICYVMRYDFKKLKAARENMMLTQTQVAAATGLSVTTVNQVELGKAPWIKAIRTIAGFLQVSDVVKSNGSRKRS